LNFFIRGLTTASFIFIGFIMENCSVAFQDANYDESKIPGFTLPDVLTANNGQPISTAQQWEGRRREIIDLFSSQMFGKRPSTQPTATYSVRDLSGDSLPFDALIQEITITLTAGTKSQAVKVLLFLPKSSQPAPIFLGPNFNGNHTVCNHSEISLPTTWVPNDREGQINDHRAVESMRGTSSSRWPIELAIESGFGVATVYCGDFDSDYDDNFAGGVHDLLRAETSSDSDPGDDNQDNAQSSDWGTISAWAWGLSKVMDYLETDHRINAQRIAVVGHSRLGKTALWAGATDSRFAMIVSNNSGCGGAALSRRRIGESVRRINTSFPHWFNQRFKFYNDNEDAAPIDQHMLIASLAPRPVYITSATQDQWADPKGEFQSAFYANPVYKLLGTQGLALEAFPVPQTPCHSLVGYHLRTGKHDITAYDWQEFITHAKMHMK